jgi:hypothetical protein
LKANAFNEVDAERDRATATSADKQFSSHLLRPDLRPDGLLSPFPVCSGRSAFICFYSTFKDTIKRLSGRLRLANRAALLYFYHKTV